MHARNAERPQSQRYWSSFPGIADFRPRHMLQTTTSNPDAIDVYGLPCFPSVMGYT